MAYIYIYIIEHFFGKGKVFFSKYNISHAMSNKNLKKNINLLIFKKHN